MSPSQRVLVVVPRGGAGGAQLAATELGRGLQEAGLVVHVVVAGDEPLDWAEPVGRVPRLERSPFAVVPVARALRRAIAEFRPDVVHNHGVGSGVAIALATRRGRRLPALTTVHGLPQNHYARATFALRLSGLPAVAVGPVVASSLARYRLAVVATVATAVPPAPPHIGRPALGSRFDLDADVRVVMQVGRLADSKNPLALVRALPMLPGTVGLFVGDGPLASRVHTTARELGVDNRVIVTGWRDDARSLLGAADVVVLPSRWEGLSRVAIEAMMAGRAIVASSNGAFDGVFTNGVDALLVDTERADLLAAGVGALLDEPERAAVLGAAAATRARDFSFDALVQAYLGLYERVAGEASR